MNQPKPPRIQIDGTDGNFQQVDSGLLPLTRVPVNVNDLADQILLGIFRELPYYCPIHEAIKRPIRALLKDLGVPGGDDEPKRSNPSGG